MNPVLPRATNFFYCRRISDSRRFGSAAFRPRKLLKSN